MSQRPPSPLTTLVCVVLCVTGVFGALVLTLLRERGAEVRLWSVGLLFVAIDFAVSAVLVGAVVRRLRQPEPPEPAQVPAASVLLPVWNEGSAVHRTVEAWAAQEGLEFELLVGDDGSTDETCAQLVAALGLEVDGPRAWVGRVRGVPVRLFRFDHGGKGATLNALARKARHGVLVTVDADTRPTAGSLRRLAGAFVDPEVDLATGVVSIANGRGGWLLGNQSAEYLRNALVRIAWSTLGALEQVPGAFCAVRAQVFHDAGGFPEDSLTEDYELAFRCVELGVRRGRPPVVVTVLRAQVFTEGPGTLKGFIAQRTRWFAGFLSTLFRFRYLVFERRAGAYGLVRLPLKLFDAVLPIIALGSVLFLLGGGLAAALQVSRFSMVLLSVRWCWDAVVYGLSLWASRRLGEPALTVKAAPARAFGWALISVEVLSYVWLKQAAALRGAWWAVTRVRTWEASRVVEPRGPSARR